MSQIQIKPIAENDIEGFYACLDAVARERKYLGLLKAPALKDTRKWLLNAMRQGEIRLVATDSAHVSSGRVGNGRVGNGRVVGWCDIEIYTRKGFAHAGKLGMGVLNGYRGQGLGKALLESALAVARDRHLERVELDVYASNQIAIHLYEKFGFQIEGRKRRARKLDGTYDDIIVMGLLFDSRSET